VVRYLPAAHEVQLDAPAAEYFPAAHKSLQTTTRHVSRE
jgi:hypothetical protein